MQQGYLIGTFDVLSVRDLDLINAARSRCDQLVVGLLSDEQVTAGTGRPPVTSLTDRFALVSRLRGVDRVVIHRAEEVGDHLVLVGADDAGHLAAEPSVQVIEVDRDTRSTVVRAARLGAAATAVA